MRVSMRRSALSQWIAGPASKPLTLADRTRVSGATQGMTQEQVRQYQKEGYVILRQAIPREWVDSLRKATDDEMASYSFSRVFTNEFLQLILYGSPRKGPYEYRGINRWKSNDAVRDFVFHSPVASLAQQAMKSKSVQIMEDLMFVKTPKQGAMSTGWHRDTNYPVPVDTEHQMTTWIPLDDTPLHEQCGVEFLSGSHRWDFNEYGYHYFTNEGIEKSQHLVRGEDVSPGDVVIFHGNIGHRTVPAPGGRLKRRRAAIAIRWGGDDAVFQRKLLGFKTFNWYDMWPHGLKNGQHVGESPHMQTIIPAEALASAPRTSRALLPTVPSLFRFVFGRFFAKSQETDVEKQQNLASCRGGANGGAKSIY